MRVAVFGWKREHNAEWLQAAERVGRVCAEFGAEVVTGGGSGTMAAANRGAGGGLGVTLPLLSGTEGVNPHAARVVMVDTFAERKRLLFENVTCSVFVPGGIGTLDEFTDLVNLYKTGAQPAAPVLLFGVSYWGGLRDLLERHGAAWGPVEAPTDDLDALCDALRGVLRAADVSRP